MSDIKEDTAEIIEQPILTTLVKIVLNKCQYNDSYMVSDLFAFDKHCKNCEFLIIKGIDNTSQAVSCDYIKYEAAIESQKTIYEEDDGSGGLPCEDYIKIIKCYSCGTGMKHSSGLSWFSGGDTLTCKKCGTFHRYIGSKPGGHIYFAVPLKYKKDSTTKIQKATMKVRLTEAGQKIAAQMEIPRRVRTKFDAVMADKEQKDLPVKNNTGIKCSDCDTMTHPDECIGCRYDW